MSLICKDGRKEGGREEERDERRGRREIWVEYEPQLKHLCILFTNLLQVDRK